MMAHRAVQQGMFKQGLRFAAAQRRAVAPWVASGMRAMGTAPAHKYDPTVMAEALTDGNRFALSKAITLVESTREDHRVTGSEVLERSLQRAVAKSEGGKKKSFRIGISGPPGVGKSTFIESLGMHLLGNGHKIAVIAVDPSSHISGGSILGDKTRMSELGMHAEAFVRPCPSAGQLGGIAQHTDEIVLLCESAGYEIVLIETVGVGQSEVLVGEISDMFLLLLPPAGGDSLQGMKRGIVEAADLIVINKADGDLLLPAKRAQGEYRNGLHYVARQHAWWQPDVLTCSSLRKESVDEVWGQCSKFWDLGTSNGAIERIRGAQRAEWMWKKAESDVCQMMRQRPDVEELAGEFRALLGRGEHSPRWAAERLVSAFLGKQAP